MFDISDFFKKWLKNFLLYINYVVIFFILHLLIMFYEKYYSLHFTLGNIIYLIDVYFELSLYSLLIMSLLFINVSYFVPNWNESSFIRKTMTILYLTLVCCIGFFIEYYMYADKLPLCIIVTLLNCICLLIPKKYLNSIGE